MDSSDPKDTGMSSTTTELKRSARLSKKRTLKDNSVIEITDRLDDSDEGGNMFKILRSNKTKSKISVTPKSVSKKYSYQDSVLCTINASSELSNVSNVQPSLNTVVDNREKMSAKGLPKTFKNKNSSGPAIVTNVNSNVSTEYNVNTAECEKTDDLVKFTRKRGRPSQKELLASPLRDDTDYEVNTPCKDEVDRRKTRSGFHEPAEKSLGESDSTALNEVDRTATPERKNWDDGPSSRPKRKRTGMRSSTTADDEIVDFCPSGPANKAAVSTTTSEHDEVLDEPKPSRDETFDREIALVSNRFNVPCGALRNIIERECVPVFREKCPDTVTPSMVTVSPVVSMTDGGKHVVSGWNSDGVAAAGAPVEYKIEPVRESAAYGKTNLKDTMVEISKAMPSWSLSIVDDPPRYVISHMSIETYGTPVADKSVVLDRYFRASVYIDQRLVYKYCKRYTTASEIVNLIKELDAIQ